MAGQRLNRKETRASVERYIPGQPLSRKEIYMKSTKEKTQNAKDEITGSPRLDEYLRSLSDDAKVAFYYGCELHASAGETSEKARDYIKHEIENFEQLTEQQAFIITFIEGALVGLNEG
jgi:hypothetical protein